MRIFTYALLLWISCPALLLGQRSFSTAKFGKVSTEELAVKGSSEAIEAGAVVLNDYGSLSFELINRKPRVVQVFHRRIKILNEKGMKVAKIELPYNLSESVITEIKGATYKPGPDGNPVTFKLDKRKIKEIKNKSGMFYKVFELPLAAPGTVIEYSYVRRVRNFAWTVDWHFQRDLPVMRSEFHSLIPASFTYQVIPSNNTDEMLRFREPYRETGFANLAASPNTQGISNPYTAGGQSVLNQLFNGTHEWFSMENLTPIERDVFTPDGNSFVPSVRIIFSRDAVSGRRNTDLFESWEDLNAFWYKKTRPQKLKLDRVGVERTVRREVGRVKGQKDRLKKLYGFVRDKWDWDETYSLDIKRLDRVWNRRSLNGTELNLILCEMARRADFRAFPVMIRTKDMGVVEMMYPSQNQFNHCIVLVELEGEDVLLDATYKQPGFGVLPEQSLNQIGYLVDPQGGRWTKLEAANKAVRVTYSRFSLNPEGLLTGEISVTNKAFGAAMERERVQRYNGDLEPYLRKYVLTGIDTAAILDNAVADHVEDDQELIVNVDLQTRAFVEQAGDFMFVKPMMTKIVASNPFPDQQRSAPIDLNYPVRESHMLGIRIPSGYEVAQVPEPIRVALPNNGGMFTYNVLEYENILHFTSTIYVNKTLFMPAEYTAIREFFEYIVQKHDEDLILRRAK